MMGRSITHTRTHTHTHSYTHTRILIHSYTHKHTSTHAHRYMRLHMEEPVKVLRPCTQTLANFACDNTPLVNRIVAAGGVTVCEEVMQVRYIGCLEVLMGCLEAFLNGLYEDTMVV